MSVMVNAWLTNNQRNWLVDEYLNRVPSDMVDEVHHALVHMKNHQFYQECKEFMPLCMQELRDAGIR
jgi:hypothetical protein